MSIINEALKKVQTNLNKKDTVVPLQEQKPPQATTPQHPKAEPPPAIQTPRKTLATIEQEEKEKELQLKKLQESMPQRRSSPLTKLLKISFFIFLLVCLSTFAFFHFSDNLKKSPFSKKFPQILVLAKSLNQSIVSLLHRPSSSKSVKSNSASSRKKISPKKFILKGILTINNHQVALINDSIYKEGSMIGNIKVIRISSKEVKLLDGDQTITLTIGGDWQ